MEKAIDVLSLIIQILLKSKVWLTKAELTKEVNQNSDTKYKSKEIEDAIEKGIEEEKIVSSKIGRTMKYAISKELKTKNRKEKAKKESPKEPEIDPRFELLITSKNYKQLSKLFDIPKEARRDYEYRYLVQNIQENYPQFLNIKPEAFLDSLDSAILDYLHQYCIKLTKEGDLLVQSDAKYIVEKGWIPMPTISDTHPRGYIIPLFIAHLTYRKELGLSDEIEQKKTSKKSPIKQSIRGRKVVKKESPEKGIRRTNILSITLDTEYNGRETFYIEEKALKKNKKLYKEMIKGRSENINMIAQNIGKETEVIYLTLTGLDVSDKLEDDDYNYKIIGTFTFDEKE